jgi:hypothetical protein
VAIYSAYFALALAATFAAEAFLSWRWQPAYFRSGVVVFSRRIFFANALPSLPHPAQLEAPVHSALTRSFVFHAISPTEVAFREKLFEIRLFSYSPLMHGVIEARPLERSVLVRGRLNWFSLLFFGAFTLFVPWHELGLFVLLLPVIFGVLYFVQAVRYHRVASVLAQSLASAT